MKIKYISVFLLVFILCGSLINASPGGSSSSPSYYSYDDFLNAAKKYQD